MGGGSVMIGTRLDGDPISIGGTSVEVNCNTTIHWECSSYYLP